MAFNSAPGRAEYTATAGQTLFPFTFKIYATSDIKVYQTSVGVPPDEVGDLLTEAVDYTVAISGDAGGTVTLLTGATLNDAVTIKRDLPVVRNIEYQESGDLLASTLNMDQDYQTYLAADVNDTLEKVVRLPANSQGASGELPAPVSDSYLRWNTAGTALENDTTIPTSVISSEDSNLEAASWANEDEDVPVKEYTASVPSDRSPTVYSAKHWAIKAQDAVIGDVEFRDTEWRVFDDLDNTKKIAFQVSGVSTATTRTITMPDSDVDLSKLIDGPKLWDPQTTTHNFTSDADYTLTATQNLYGNIIITDTTPFLTTARNIITDNAERSFTIQNDTLQDLTIKTLAGTGVVVIAGSIATLHNDGTDVVISSQEIGANQKWQDVTASRSSGATYTNTTGVPIEVKVVSNSTANGNNVIILTVDGIIMDRFTIAVSGAGFYASVGAIIPDGVTYSCTIAGVGALNKWAELR